VNRVIQEKSRLAQLTVLLLLLLVVVRATPDHHNVALALTLTLALVPAHSFFLVVPPTATPKAHFRHRGYSRFQSLRNSRRHSFFLPSWNAPPPRTTTTATTVTPFSSLTCSSSTAALSSLENPLPPNEAISEDCQDLLLLVQKIHQLDELARRTSQDESVAETARLLVQNTVQQQQQQQQQIITDDAQTATTMEQWIVMYNLLLEIYAYSQRFEGAEWAEELLQQMEQQQQQQQQPPQPLVNESEDASTSCPSNHSFLPPPPNTTSYELVMKAWIQRRQLSRVQAIFDRAVLAATTMTTQPSPDHYLALYNRLIQAHGILGLADQARALLEQVLNHNHPTEEEHQQPADDGTSAAAAILQSLKPNENTWVQVMRAYATPHYATASSSFNDPSDDKPDEHASPLSVGVAAIDSLLQQMQQYNGAIACGSVPANNALLQALHYCGGPVAAKRAEQTLYDMIQRYNQHRHDPATPNDPRPKLRPTPDSFYHVIMALGNSNQKKNTKTTTSKKNAGPLDASISFKIDNLLELEYALHEDGRRTREEDDNDQHWRRNRQSRSRLYKAALAVVARTKDTKKAVKAKKILQRLQEMNPAHNTEEEEDDDPERDSSMMMVMDRTVYKNVLRCCAFTNSQQPQDKLTAFSIAVEVLREMKASDSETLRPDSAIYGLFLRSCANLLPATKKRDVVVEKVFVECCQEGWMNDYVLREFTKAASKELQSHVLGEFSEGGSSASLPDEWSQNARAMAESPAEKSWKIKTNI